MKIKLTGSVNHDGKRYEAGDIVEATQDEAVAIIAAGVAQELTAAEKRGEDAQEAEVVVKASKPKK